MGDGVGGLGLVARRGGVPACFSTSLSCQWLPTAGSWGSLGRGPAAFAAGAPPAPVWVPSGCRGAQGRFAYKLLHDLFANYSSALRPVEDTDRALNVTLQITLSQIIDMVSGRSQHRDRQPGPAKTGPSLSRSWSPLSRALLSPSGSCSTRS